jgi:RNA-directed DNA polymerase
MPLGTPGKPTPPPGPRGSAPRPAHVAARVPPPGGKPTGASSWGCLATFLVLAAACAGGAWLLVRARAGGGRVLLWSTAAAVAIAFLVWVLQRKQRLAVARLHGLAPCVKQLARRLGATEAELRAHRPAYREVRIRKRRGGTRVLHVPDDRTKALQRRILRRLLDRMPAADAAFGFERGRSIAGNAARHVGRAIVLRFDVVDFFPATRAPRVEAMYLRFGWSAEAAAILARLTTHAGGLPQGAPTSPRLSNLVNRALDRDLARWVEARHGRYTRYADDITVSFPEDWKGEPGRTRAAVERAFRLRGYRLHGREKSSVRRRHQRQVVTGLVVNAKVAIPRTMRRLLRAARHNLAKGRPCTFTPQQLEGWAAYAHMVRSLGADVPAPWTRTHPSTSPRRRP